MKIAVAGKGGVGKTTIAALLARTYANRGFHVIAVDADPAACLAAALGLPAELQRKLIPISAMSGLIKERTGADKGAYGTYFRLNPRVEDISELYSVQYAGIRLLRMGSIDEGGSGCICPESALIKALVTHLMLHDQDLLIMDMDAGLEHLGRATAHAVDRLLIVVEPGMRSIDTARQIAHLARDIGIQRLSLIGNKVRGPEDLRFLHENQGEIPLVGALPYVSEAIQADQQGTSIFDAAPLLARHASELADALQSVPG